MSRLITRRGLIIGGAAAAGTVFTGCARVDSKWPVPAVLDAADAFTRGAQRLLLGQRPLARELSLADISARFPLSGTFMPKADTYKRLLDEDLGPNTGKTVSDITSFNPDLSWALVNVSD